MRLLPSATTSFFFSSLGNHTRDDGFRSRNQETCHCLFLLFLWLFAVSGYYQCGAMHRKEKAPGEVKRKTFVGIIKICCVFLVRFADKRRNSEPHREVFPLENQHLFMLKTPCGDMKTRDVRTKASPGGASAWACGLLQYSHRLIRSTQSNPKTKARRFLGKKTPCFCLERNSRSAIRIYG